MRLFVETLAATLALSSNFAESESSWTRGKMFGGGPATYNFSDSYNLSPDLKQIKFFVGGDVDGTRVTSVGITHPPFVPRNAHGVDVGVQDVKYLGDDEYIDRIICDSNGLVINYLSMSTNKNRSVAGGNTTVKIIDDMIDRAPPGHKLGGFFGTGDTGGLVSLQGAWICKEDAPCSTTN